MADHRSAHARFQQAVERCNLLSADAAARELGRLSLADALDFLLLLADKEPARFERAAVRWHGRFALEVAGLGIADSQLLLAALAGLREPARRLPLETIAMLAERFRATSITLAARRAMR